MLRRKHRLRHRHSYVSYDIRTFHRLRALKRTVTTQEGFEARREFDRVAASLVKAFEVDVIALGGYMSYLTLGRCINVHPADLSILTPKGKRKYVGDNAVVDAIAAGENSCDLLPSGRIGAWTPAPS